jgi:prophage DNA circulation protein
MSTECRDWLKTLWPASYKGVPFFFESDKENGGRGLIVHTFPNRDDPYIEDLGEEPRFYSGSAYVAGDTADSLAAALKSVLASRGPGPLVVPYFGPVTVHCETFERATHRDRMGYVAFEAKFVRAGAASAFVSIAAVQNIAYRAADTMASAISTLFPVTITSQNESDFVIASVTDTIADAAAAVDVLRQSYPVDPTASAALRDQITTLIGSAPASISDVAVPGAGATAIAASFVSIVRGLGDALPAASATAAMLDLVAAYDSTTIEAAPYLSPTGQRSAANKAATMRMVRLAALTAYAESILATTFVARPDGVTARGEVAERFENELYNTTGAANAALYLAIEDLRGKVISWLTQTINNLAPIVIVDSAIVRPSLALAWLLYADPTRSDELVARNNVRHPSFMPRQIEALSR